MGGELAITSRSWYRRLCKEHLIFTELRPHKRTLSTPAEVGLGWLGLLTELGTCIPSETFVQAYCPLTRALHTETCLCGRPTSSKKSNDKERERKSLQSNASSEDHTAMATASASFSMLGWVGRKKAIPRHERYTVMAQQQQQQAEVQQQQQQKQKQNSLPQQEQANAEKQPPVSQPQQPMAKNKNMFREYGGQWLSSVTRHVRIYAAYIDPVTHAFDQTQMDKLTLILDPTNEFVWTPETCNKVYTYFQELVDHYEGAPLTEYTLRLIGSDIEHYIRKMLYDGEIKYNMNAQVLNFSMGKPRVIFKNQHTENVP